MSDSETKIYPLMPLRDIVIFSGMVAPLVVGRKKSIGALETAMENRSLIFLVSPMDVETEDPNREHLYEVGTLATVMQLLRLPECLKIADSETTLLFYIQSAAAVKAIYK